MRSDVSFRIFPFERFPSFEKASASVSKSVSVLWSISLINVTSKRSRRGQSETRTRKCDSAVRSSVEVAASHPDRILFVVVFHGPAPIQGYRRSFRPYISFPYLSLSLSLSLSLLSLSVSIGCRLPTPARSSTPWGPISAHVHFARPIISNVVRREKKNGRREKGQTSIRTQILQYNIKMLIYLLIFTILIFAILLYLPYLLY